MKSLLKDKILRITLLTLVVVAFSIESKAQLLTMDRLIKPFLNFNSEAMSGEESPSEELNNEKGYLDNGILIFKENLKVCKDIVSGSSQNKDLNEQTILNTENKCINCKDNTAIKQDTVARTKKKRSKKFRNFPGNIRSRI
ncbi:hypothetical protein [Marinifilum sp.]|uniref:hypothetical protein n=1 Tax=Marinifilum sp. TaxID=2033137 RepID=UPI003BACD5CC